MPSDASSTHGDAENRAQLSTELRSLILESTPSIDVIDDLDQPLISSGLVNSNALLDIVLWVEQKTSQPIDFTSIDISRELDSINSILDFVERCRI